MGFILQIPRAGRVCRADGDDQPAKPGQPARGGQVVGCGLAVAHAKADFQADLIVTDFAVDDMPAGFHHFEPVHIADSAKPITAWPKRAKSSPIKGKIGLAFGRRVNFLRSV